MEDIEMTQTGIGRVMLKDGIVYLWVDVDRLTTENVGAHFAKVYELAERIGPVPMPVLIDFQNLRSIDRDARQLVAQMLTSEYNQRLAVVCHNPVQRVMASFFIGFNKVEVPVYLSHDRESAEAWLRAGGDEPTNETGDSGGQPSDRLHAAANALLRMASGDFSCSLEVTPAMDEVDAVSVGISMLSEEIESLLLQRRQAEAELERNQENLEGLVQERTSQLVQANEALAAEVRERKQQQQELERINAELDVFARTVSHDLKGPLTSIAMSGETISALLERNLDRAVIEGLRESAGILARNTHRLAKLIEDLLVLAEAGQEPEYVEEVDVSGVVDEIIDDLASLIREKGPEIVRDPDLGTVNASHAHVYQLFSNLIFNAITHNDNPAPVVTVRLLGGLDGEHRYIVRDNGAGIPEEDLDNIFLPYFKGETGATGIGLSTVSKIVNVYGGEIRAFNDNGACFEFSLRDYPDGGPPVG